MQSRSALTCVSEGGATPMHLQQIMAGAHLHLCQAIKANHLLTVTHPENLTPLWILKKGKNKRQNTCCSNNCSSSQNYMEEHGLKCQKTANHWNESNENKALYHYFITVMISMFYLPKGQKSFH